MAAETYGLGHDGFFTEYTAVKEWAAVPVPEGKNLLLEHCHIDRSRFHHRCLGRGCGHRCRCSAHLLPRSEGSCEDTIE